MIAADFWILSNCGGGCGCISGPMVYVRNKIKLLLCILCCYTGVTVTMHNKHILCEVKLQNLSAHTSSGVAILEFPLQEHI